MLSTLSLLSEDSWTTDEEDYQTFVRHSTTSIRATNINYYRVDSPKPEVYTPIKAAKRVPLRACTSRTPSERVLDEEPIYENLASKGSDMVALYGQMLRSKLSQIKDGRRRKQVKGNIVQLFQIEADVGQSTETIAKLVEEKLDLLLDNDPRKFRRSAEQLCHFLHKVKEDKLNRLQTIRKSICRIFIK